VRAGRAEALPTPGKGQSLSLKRRHDRILNEVSAKLLRMRPENLLSAQSNANTVQPEGYHKVSRVSYQFVSKGALSYGHCASSHENKMRAEAYQITSIESRLEGGLNVPCGIFAPAVRGVAEGTANVSLTAEAG